ncbi:MAG: indole-3-glycerol phosphate synthase TrpC [Vampirovibrionales bacterium]
MNSLTLAKLLEDKQEETEAQARIRPLAQLKEEVVALHAPVFLNRLTQPEALHLICEIKPASPTAGKLVEQLDLLTLLETYHSAASCISVLADKKHFGGGPALLKHITQLTPHPTLYKDFVISEYQVYQARWAWADAFLLVAKALPDTAKLQALYELGTALGMTPLIEVQNEAEVERVLKVITPELLLVNHRNFDDFTVDLTTTQRLHSVIPRDVHIIAASGIKTLQDIQAVYPYAQRFLVGSSLMQASPEEARERLTAWKAWASGTIAR